MDFMGDFLELTQCIPPRPMIAWLSIIHWTMHGQTLKRTTSQRSCYTVHKRSYHNLTRCDCNNYTKRFLVWWWFHNDFSVRADWAELYLQTHSGWFMYNLIFIAKRVVLCVNTPTLQLYIWSVNSTYILSIIDERFLHSDAELIFM